MRIQVKHAHGRPFQVSLCGDFTELQELKQEIIQQTLPFLEQDDFYLEHNGRILYNSEQLRLLLDGHTVNVVPRVLGGKGGFGSMLRAIGAQIEKTTNRDACRDLSGRRLRDINEEKRLKKWYARQAEREEEKKEIKKRKLEKLRKVADGPPLPKIDDQDYLQQREDIMESVCEAVGSSTEIFPDDKQKVEEAAGSSSSSSADKPAKKTIKKTMFDEELSSDFSSDDDDSEEESSPSKKAKSSED